MATTKTTSRRRSKALQHMKSARRIMATIKWNADSEHRKEMADLAIDAIDVAIEEIKSTTKTERPTAGPRMNWN